MRPYWLLALALSAASVNACSAEVTDDSFDDEEAATRDPNAAQMNDLTIVAPLPKSAKEVDSYMAATTVGRGGALLPKSIVGAMVPDADGPLNPGRDVSMTYPSLRVVGIRFDPCFANVGPITKPESCDNQIRLIFQSIASTKDGGTAIDGAVHAFYRVTRAELTSAIQEVVALRKANSTGSLGALAAHPILVKQGMGGAFSVGLAKIIEKYAGAKNLMRFTVFQSANLQTVWNFSGFDVSGNKLTPMVIPTLPSKGVTQGFFAGFAAPMSGGFTPETTSKDDVALLTNPSKAQAATPTQRKAAFDASLRIVNPNFHSPNTIDCAGCHVAQDARVLVGEGKLGLSADGNVNAFAADPKFVSKTMMKQTTSPTKQQGINVHMMSYRNTNLLIGDRVINETASVLAYVNGTILAKR